MDEHVDFVSNLYSQVKVPFHYLIDYVGHLTGREDSTEEIESSDQLSLTYKLI